MRVIYNILPIFAKSMQNLLPRDIHRLRSTDISNLTINIYQGVNRLFKALHQNLCLSPNPL